MSGARVLQVRPSPPVLRQPTAAELRERVLAGPTSRLTRHGSVNVRTRVRSRARRSTFLVTDALGQPTAVLRRADGERLARLQDAYLAEAGQVVVDGYLGAPGPLRLAVRVITETAAVSIAAMHRHLLFDPAQGDSAFEPDLVVLSTPGLAVPGAPDGCLVAVWRDEGVTRVMGTDFFGETKKALTRMWGERVFDSGGLVLHAACLVVPTARGALTVVVTGPPDSGKSTLVMRDPSVARLVQDDFVALLPGGRVVPAENGCIEKTWGLNAVRQPLLHHAVTRPEAYLENVPQRGSALDFGTARGPRHARAVVPLGSLGGVADAPIPPLGLLVLLDPGHELAPAAAQVGRDQVPGLFLLRERGEGLAERTGRQGNRLAELLATADVEAVVLNTGVLPRDPPDRLRQGAWPIVRALAHGAVTWEDDRQLGCRAATGVPGVPDPDVAWPRRRYLRDRDLAGYARAAEVVRTRQRDYLAGFVGLDPQIVRAVT